MLFKPELIVKIVLDQKHQTRRLVKPSHVPICFTANTRRFDPENSRGYRGVAGKWKVGHDYAVQPGRGKPGVFVQGDEIWSPTKDALGHWQVQSGFKPLRIRILGIHREDVRDISLFDARQEGFENEIEFWRVWCALNDPRYDFSDERPGKFSEYTKRPVAEVRNRLLWRPVQFYDCWKLVFEVVK